MYMSPLIYFINVGFKCCLLHFKKLHGVPFYITRKIFTKNYFEIVFSNFIHFILFKGKPIVNIFHFPLIFFVYLLIFSVPEIFYSWLSLVEWKDQEDKEWERKNKDIFNIFNYHVLINSRGHKDYLLILFINKAFIQLCKLC